MTENKTASKKAGNAKPKRARGKAKGSKPRKKPKAKPDDDNIADAPEATQQEKQEAKPRQADILIHLAEAADLFHDADDKGYAYLAVNGHRESWAIRSKGFKRWLAHKFYELTKGAANSDAFAAALNVIEANAHYKGPKIDTHIRVAELNGKVYLDLCDDAWRAVEIDPEGWRIVETPPVRFRRAKGMKPLVIPAAGGSIETLQPFLNLQSKTDFVLLVACLLAMFRPRGPYPVIILSGEQGTSKSTLSRMLRSLIDPSTTPLRTLPREEGAATGGRLVGRLYRGEPSHPRRAARCRVHWSQAASLDPAIEDSEDGRLRHLGDRVRDGLLAGGDVHVRL